MSDQIAKIIKNLIEKGDIGREVELKGALCLAYYSDEARGERLAVYRWGAQPPSQKELAIVGNSLKTALSDTTGDDRWRTQRSAVASAKRRKRENGPLKQMIGYALRWEIDTSIGINAELFGESVQ